MARFTYRYTPRSQPHIAYSLSTKYLYYDILICSNMDLIEWYSENSKAEYANIQLFFPSSYSHSIHINICFTEIF